MIGTWTHRVMRKTESNGDISYGIYEVYGEKGSYSWSETPVSVDHYVDYAFAEPEELEHNNMLEELRQWHGVMGKALEKPVLDYETGEEIE